MLTDWRENNGRANTNKVLRMRRARYCFLRVVHVFGKVNFIKSSTKTTTGIHRLLQNVHSKNTNDHSSLSLFPILLDIHCKTE